MGSGLVSGAAPPARGEVPVELLIGFDHMLALISVWLGLGSFLLAAIMFIYRPAMTDLSILLVLYFGAPGALCLAVLVLWSNRNDANPEPGVHAQRLQCKFAIVLALAAAAIVYALIIGSHKIE